MVGRQPVAGARAAYVLRSLSAKPPPLPDEPRLRGGDSDRSRGCSTSGLSSAVTAGLAPLVLGPGGLDSIPAPPFRFTLIRAERAVLYARHNNWAVG